MKYTGGCHCKAVRYEVEADINQTISCNCSICAMKSLVLGFAPRNGFKLLSGADQLSEYRFNKKVIRHLFCKNCGVQSFSEGEMPDGTKMVAINLRCLDGVDVAQLKPAFVDGKSS